MSPVSSMPADVPTNRSDGSLAGRVALITGAARGQGRSHAVRLAAEGADIVLIDACADLETVAYPMPTPRDLADTAALVEAAGRRAVTAVADVRDLAGLTSAVDAAVERLGRLDIVVANAGIASYAKGSVMTDDQWTEMIDVNLTGVWRTYRACIGHLQRSGSGGSIIFTSSVAGLRGIANAAHYGAAKHGLVGLMRVLALEHGAERIRVNTIHPTTVDTGMVDNDATRELFLPNPDRPRTQEAFERVAQTLNVLPVPWIQPEVVSDLVAFLVSDAGQFITGAAIPVDAGMTARW
ncbi:mycofactocin-coupled SDR family oxidoreductase [Mycobacterium sp. 236(2023)]|uniref:mycofactocin-coupled SDR family oxidoreductase n=1 Tax=Mycobacterium sp. 236(2023) TaxID=3038163 RepID=UPI002415212F|nr:mycofactocin-coupled SDR family oxidoreductase [Mycobacterium sp. 236(2023)]MDG4668080.1 mycofactocin-coupled SDR family oxidoreductase [Mycobacterium sp. 236(2023)]